MFNWLKELDRYLPVRYAVWLLCAVAAPTRCSRARSCRTM